VVCFRLTSTPFRRAPKKTQGLHFSKLAGTKGDPNKSDLKLSLRKAVRIQEIKC
jgi:hypothetical protein